MQMHSASLMQNIKQLKISLKLKISAIFLIKQFLFRKKQNNMDIYQYVISNLKHKASNYWLQ